MDKLNIKEWADNKFAEHKKDIEYFIAQGISKVKAFHTVMDASTLGAGYNAQMRQEIGLGIFDK